MAPRHGGSARWLRRGAGWSPSRRCGRRRSRSGAAAGGRHGGQTSGEFARGFGVRHDDHLIQTSKANQTRLKTATEFARADQAGTLTRHALYATCRATATSDVTESLSWLRTELPNYYGPARESAAAVLRYLATMDMEHWNEDAEAAKLVGRVENDHV